MTAFIVLAVIPCTTLGLDSSDQVAAIFFILNAGGVEFPSDVYPLFVIVEAATSPTRLAFIDVPSRCTMVSVVFVLAYASEASALLPLLTTTWEAVRPLSVSPVKVGEAPVWILCGRENVISEAFCVTVTWLEVPRIAFQTLVTLEEVRFATIITLAAPGLSGQNA